MDNIFAQVYQGIFATIFDNMALIISIFLFGRVYDVFLSFCAICPGGMKQLKQQTKKRLCVVRCLYILFDVDNNRESAILGGKWLWHYSYGFTAFNLLLPKFKSRRCCRHSFYWLSPLDSLYNFQFSSHGQYANVIGSLLIQIWTVPSGMES